MEDSYDVVLEPEKDEPITFYIYEDYTGITHEYNIHKKMTWQEFINSEYNVVVCDEMGTCMKRFKVKDNYVIFEMMNYDDMFKKYMFDFSVELLDYNLNNDNAYICHINTYIEPITYKAL